MDSFSADMESSIESELIDLSAVSMTALREWDNIVLRQALQQVIQQTVHPQVTAGGSSPGAERID